MMIKKILFCFMMVASVSVEAISGEEIEELEARQKEWQACMKAREEAKHDETLSKDLCSVFGERVMNPGPDYWARRARALCETKASSGERAIVLFEDGRKVDFCDYEGKAYFLAGRGSVKPCRNFHSGGLCAHEFRE